jgi:hypothetical protein
MMLNAESADDEAGCCADGDAEVPQPATVPGCARRRIDVAKRNEEIRRSRPRCSEQDNVGGVYVDDMMMIEKLDNFDLSM